MDYRNYDIINLFRGTIWEEIQQDDHLAGYYRQFADIDNPKCRPNPFCRWCMFAPCERSSGDEPKDDAQIHPLKN